MSESAAFSKLVIERADVAVEPLDEGGPRVSLGKYVEGAILILGVTGIAIALTAISGGESSANASEHGTSSCNGDGEHELVSSDYVYYPDGNNVDVETAAGCLYRETVQSVYCEGNLVNKDTAQGYPDNAACQYQEHWKGK